MMAEMKRKKRILVIDDDASIRDMISETLGPRGYEVLAVSDPHVGVQTAKETRPDLVFMSLIFSDSNGLKVSKMLHSVEQLKTVPIVMLITYQGELDPKYTATIGIVDVLIKPLNPGDIVSKTKNLLDADVFSPEVEKAVAGHRGVEELDISALDKEWFLALGQEGIQEFQEEGKPAREETSDREHDEHDFFQQAGKKDKDMEKGDKTETADKLDDYIDYEIDEVNIKKGKDIKEEGERGGDDALKDLSYDDTEAKKSPAIKIVIIAASVLLIASLVPWALQIKNYFHPHKVENVLSPSVKNPPAKNESVRGEAEKEKTKPQEIAPAAGSDKSDKRTDSQPAAEKAKIETPSVPSTGQLANTVSPTVAKPSVKKVTRTPDKEMKEPKVAEGKTEFVYFVQAGVFADARNARALVKKMKEKGYDASVQEDSIGKRSKVLIGKFDDKKKALEQSRILLQKEGIKAIIYRQRMVMS